MDVFSIIHILVAARLMGGVEACWEILDMGQGISLLIDKGGWQIN